MYQILEQIQTEVYTIGDTYTKVRVRLVCDALSDLPGIHDISGLELQMGSTAHIITTAQNMMMQSNGTWSEQTSSSIASLVNDISMLQSDVSALENRIGEAENKITQLQEAAAGLIDRGAKNLLNWSASSTATITITNNNDGTFNASGSPTSVVSILLGWIYNLSDTDKLYLSGCPAGGSQASGYSLLAADSGGSMIAPDEGSGVNFQPRAGEDRVRIYVRFRPGTYTDLKFSPMVTLQAFAAYTKKFVPYSPSNAELYALIHSYHP